MEKLNSLLKEFQERRRKQDNDLFYYINTMVEVDQILFELRGQKEDAKRKGLQKEEERIDEELQDYQRDYEQYVLECQRILQDMSLSDLSSYDEVEAKQSSLEWERINFILMLLTEYHDVVNTLSLEDEDYEKSMIQVQRLASMINGRYRRIFEHKKLEDYNLNLFGEPKDLIDVEKIKNREVLLETKEEKKDELSLDEVLELQEQRVKDQEDYARSTLSHIVDDKKEDWLVYLNDFYHLTRGKELVSYMEKLENGYSFMDLRNDLKSVNHGDEIVLALAKYSKEYQRQEKEYQQMVEEKMKEKFEPVVNESKVSYPSFLEKESEVKSREVWPELNTYEKARTSKDVVSELFFYIHKLDMKRNQKTDLGKFIETTHIDMEELSSLNFSQKSQIDDVEDMLQKIHELLLEYKFITGKDIDVEQSYQVIQKMNREEKKEESKKRFVWLRKAKEQLKLNIKKHKKALFAVAFAGLFVSGLASSKMMNKNVNSSVSTKAGIETEMKQSLVSLEENEMEPLILKHETKPVISIDSEVSSLKKEEDLMGIHIGDQVRLKENALIYRTEYLNTNFGGDMQGRIPSYQRDLVRGVEGIAFRMPDKTVKLVYDQASAKFLYDSGNKIESILTFDGFYSIDDALVVEVNTKGMSL